MPLKTLFHKLLKRGLKYTLVGVNTLLLDLSLVFLMINTTTIPYPAAVGIGFFFGINLNYYISYHWVYRGTRRKFHHGYLFFVTFAVLGALIISLGTTALVEIFGLSILIARLCVGAATGITGFLLNTFFNFKVI